MARQGVQLAYPFEEKRFKSWVREAGRVIIQPKLNGERMKWTGTTLVSSEGNIVVSVPHIVDELEERFPGFPLDGEAYVHRMPRQQIRSITGRTKNLHPHHDRIQYHIFDIPDTKTPQAIRSSILIKPELHLEGTHLYIVQTSTVTTVRAVRDTLGEYVANGYEGVILRHPYAMYMEKRSVYMMKWKPKHRDVYTVVALLEGAGKYEGTLGALVVADADGRHFHVGSFAVDDRERDMMWRDRDKLHGAKVQIRYAELTEEGVPPSSVFECILERGEEE